MNHYYSEMALIEPKEPSNELDNNGIVWPLNKHGQGGKKFGRIDCIIILPQLERFTDHEKRTQGVSFALKIITKEDDGNSGRTVRPEPLK